MDSYYEIDEDDSWGNWDSDASDDDREPEIEPIDPNHIPTATDYSFEKMFDKLEDD